MLLYDKIEEVYVAQKLSDQLNLVHVAGKKYEKEETKTNASARSTVMLYFCLLVFCGSEHVLLVTVTLQD